jgi:orotidine-5'-phosphate decarboxylase
MAAPFFSDRLAEAIAGRDAPCVVGLDPRTDMLPEFTKRPASGARCLEPEAAAVVEWGAAIIEAVAPIVPVVKPQSAFYERLGPDGYRALARTIRTAQDAGLLVVLDVKRADIGSTAEAYAETVFSAERLAADAATVVHYFGTEGVQPFLQYLDDGKGVFIVTHSSNHSAVDTQDVLLADGSPYYHLVGRLAAEWGACHIGDCGYGSVGAVVGGTFPGQIATLRGLFPTLPFLIPGYGQQGAAPEDVAAGFGASPGGAIVSASRSIYSLSPGQKGITRDEFVAIVAGRTATMAREVLAVA